MDHSCPFLSLLPFLMLLVCGLHVLGQQGQSLVSMAAIQPALEQLTIKQEYWGRREGRGGKWKEGKTIHCIVFVGTWVERFGLVYRKGKAKKRQRARGAATDMITEMIIERWCPVNAQGPESNTHCTWQFVPPTHTHTHTWQCWRRKRVGRAVSPVWKRQGEWMRSGLVWFMTCYLLRLKWYWEYQCLDGIEMEGEMLS